ncbi:hypothetical protein GCM10010357_66490 [Streptomyces luteireticuli]|uniref:Uncharacterized protein n=1 Tax=Streptomyces luteireticuli TaxID=173858 RepID=A0ABN0Z6J0_9ACTN
MGDFMRNALIRADTARIMRTLRQKEGNAAAKPSPTPSNALAASPRPVEAACRQLRRSWWPCPAAPPDVAGVFCVANV